MKGDYEKPDFWSLKAAKEGYPARSVYKLSELDEKFTLFPKNTSVKSGKGDLAGKAGKAGKVDAAPFKVLDLGAAPGSWTLYVLKKAARCFLVSCDMKPLDKSISGKTFAERLFFLQGDFTTDGTRSIIKEHAPYNLVLSDAAPSTSGNKGLDATRSSELADFVISFSKEILAKDGKLVVKVFQGAETAALLQKTRAFFRETKTFKPSACRSNSVETYIYAAL